MNDFSTTPKGEIRIFAAGGCGSNIASMLEQHRDQDEIGFGKIDICYIDTSRSNFKKHINQSNAYLFESMDGSGKVRSENSAEINDRIKAILQKFKPADLNIVISSAAGGSGSVIAPLLTGELLSSDAPTIVLTVGSADTRLDAENTLKTIKSFESIAKRSGAPVVMMYIQNSQSTTRAQADNILFNAIMALAVLFSRQTPELDTRDLFNWLRFDRVTSFPVQLASLSIIEHKDTIADIGNVISVATIAKEGVSTTLIEMPEYQCVGFLPVDIGEPVQNKSPLHFVISDGIIPEVGKSLQKILNTIEQQQNARVKRAAVLSDKDIPDDTGLVL